jgi:hypothetical protein
MKALSTIRIEPSVIKLRGCGPGFGAGFDVDWWRQTETLFVVEVSVETLFVVEVSVELSAFRGGRRARLRIGVER